MPSKPPMPFSLKTRIRTLEIFQRLIGHMCLILICLPCQVLVRTFRKPGSKRGGEKGSGTRSSLLWECEKAIEIKRPKFILFENVAAVVSSKFIKGFNKWQDTLTDLGYTNFVKLLNSRDFGIPQNRLRVFMVSILDFDGMFHFPKKMPLEKRLKDVLEENVDEKYYLKEEQVQRIIEHCDRKVAEGCNFHTNFNDGGV